MSNIREQIKVSQREIIRDIRQHYGLSQEGFAKAIGFEKTTVWFYENGKRLMSADFMYSVYETFGIAPDMMLGIRPIRWVGKINSLQK